MDNTRLRHLLILAAASLFIAGVCFCLGGVIAEAASAAPIMGVTFKAGGALAGFIVSFVILFRAYRSIGAMSLMLTVAVTPKSGRFAKTGNIFKAKITVLETASGARTEYEAEPIWAAGNLTVHLRRVPQDDLVRIVLTDGTGGHWESDFFSPLCPSITLM
jgi:hypothetical protein